VEFAEFSYGHAFLRNFPWCRETDHRNGLSVGIDFLPGMMTGQILAGSDPMLAIRYQIVVMLMIVASTALTVVAVLHIVGGRCFGSAPQPLLKQGR